MLPNEVFLMQYYDPLRKFMHLKVVSAFRRRRTISRIFFFVLDDRNFDSSRASTIRNDFLAGKSIRHRLRRRQQKVLLETMKSWLTSTVFVVPTKNTHKLLMRTVHKFDRLRLGRQSKHSNNCIESDQWIGRNSWGLVGRENRVITISPGQNFFYARSNPRSITDHRIAEILRSFWRPVENVVLFDLEENIFT